MKKLLCFLFLTTTLWAAPPFGVQFDKAHRTHKTTEGMTYEAKLGDPDQSQVLIVMKKRLELSGLRNKVRKEMPDSMGKVEESKTRVSGYPAILLSGLSIKGVPYSVILVSTPKHSLFIGSCSYNQQANDKFVRSVKL